MVQSGYSIGSQKPFIKGYSPTSAKGQLPVCRNRLHRTATILGRASDRDSHTEGHHIEGRNGRLRGRLNFLRTEGMRHFAVVIADRTNFLFGHAGGGTLKKQGIWTCRHFYFAVD